MTQRRSQRPDKGAATPAPAARPNAAKARQGHSGEPVATNRAPAGAADAEAPEAVVSDTKEIEALADSLNHSAERSQTLWLSFLTFGVYLAMAVGTTTHVMLLRENPLSLPILNIQLPLIGFYVLAPVIFVILHFYMLLNLMLLARTAKAFDAALAKISPPPNPTNEAFRMRIENTLFVQLLVGARSERSGLNARLISAMALTTLAIAPVALLLFIEVRFLPYHSEMITWLHRGLLVVDLGLIGALWSAYRSGWGLRLLPGSSFGWASLVIFGLVALTYAGAIANFPGERAYRWFFWLRPEAHPPDPFDMNSQPWYAAIWPANTLDVHNEDLVADARLREAQARETRGRGRFEPTLRLRGRNLIGADFSGADIRHVDFTGADLTQADLTLAWATEARFDCAGSLIEGCAKLNEASLAGAELEGASFRGAKLVRASLVRAQLQGAGFDAADLIGAALDRSELAGTSFFHARLSGATLRNASLQGAVLDDSFLEAAAFDGAKLQGASLKGARLLCATFIEAELQGAALDGAHLVCAALPKARLEGASFDAAQLQGASLDGAQLAGASFAHAFVWRADARAALWPEVPSVRLEGARPARLTACRGGASCPWTAENTKALKWEIENIVPTSRGPAITKPTSLELTPGIVGGDPRDEALQRIATRIEPNSFADETAIAQEWEEHIRAPFSESDFDKAVAEAWRGVAVSWRNAGCDVRGAPYGVRALARLLKTGESVAPSTNPVLGPPEGASRMTQHSDERVWLAKEFLKADTCPGSRGLSDEEINSLRAIADELAPRTP